MFLAQPGVPEARRRVTLRTRAVQRT
jgi:hypothetical protein